MTVTELRTWLDARLRQKYGIGQDEMEITDVPGYWHDRVPQQRCCWRCNKLIHRSYSYFDGRLPNGRFGSPYRTWKALKEAETAMGSGSPGSTPYGTPTAATTPKELTHEPT